MTFAGHNAEALVTSARVPPVFVTGATGRIGRAVVAQLLDASVPVRALTRRPDAAGLPAAVDVVAGDLTVPESLDAGLQGVGSVFLLWTAPPATAPAVIERLASHARRVVFLSSPHQTPHPFFQQPNPMAALHAEIERRIQNSGLQWTFLRPGMFAANALRWRAPTIRTGSAVRWPNAEAPTAPIHEGDIAAVAVRALCENGHSGKDYVLTGPQLLSQLEQVGIIGEAIGRPLRYEEISPEEARRELLPLMPLAVIDMLMNAWAAGSGWPAYITTSVADLTGTPARTFSDWVTDHAAEFRA